MSLRAWLRWAGRALLAQLLGLALLPAAQAHLMVAQRGTLNIVADGAYLVLSLPVSAFQGVDDDNDGQWSPAELQAHAARVEAQVLRGVQLQDAGRALPLQGLLLQLSPADHAAHGAANQVVVMGRFALGGAGPGGGAQGPQHAGLRLQLTLFGAQADERAQVITISRADQAQRLLLTPERNQGALLPSGWATLTDHTVQGMRHVLQGPDHLLFLLVVLASSGGLRQLLLVLTCFTLGHATTLAASALGGLAVPASVVEPAIALTIVGMALFDRWAQRRSRLGAPAWPQAVRLALVLGCALVHGLGLADTLGELGLDTAHRLWSLAGFNLGVELAQIGVALTGAAVALGLRRSWGAVMPAPAARLATAWAVATGSFWFVQRMSGLG